MAPYAYIFPSGRVVVPWFVAERPPGSIDERAGRRGGRAVEADDASIDRDDVGEQVGVRERGADVASTDRASPALTACAGLDGERRRLVLEPAAGRLGVQAAQEEEEGRRRWPAT